MMVHTNKEINYKESQSRWMKQTKREWKTGGGQRGKGEEGISEDAEQDEEKKVVKDGLREQEGRKISSPHGIICHLSH